MKNVILALAVSAFATPVVASNGNWPVGHDEIHVVDDTINVGSVEGRRLLLARIEKAARTLCEPYPQLTRRGRRECEEDIVRQTASKPHPWGRALATALTERGVPKLAAR